MIKKLSLGILFFLFSSFISAQSVYNPLTIYQASALFCKIDGSNGCTFGNGTISTGGNSSFNQTFTDARYALIGAGGGNSSFNQTFTDSKYLMNQSNGNTEDANLSALNLGYNLTMNGTIRQDGVIGVNLFKSALDVDTTSLLTGTDYQVRFRSNNTAFATKFAVEGANLAGTTWRSVQGGTNAKNWQLYVGTTTGATIRSINLGLVNDAFSAENFVFQIKGEGYVPGNFSFMNNVKVGWSAGNTMTNPTARLHLATGSATINTAPLKFTSGTLLTTPEVGAVEYLTDTLYFTRVGVTRKKFVFENDTQKILLNIVNITNVTVTQVFTLEAINAPTCNAFTNRSFIINISTNKPVYCDGLSWNQLY